MTYSVLLSIPTTLTGPSGSVVVEHINSKEFKLLNGL